MYRVSIFVVIALLPLDYTATTNFLTAEAAIEKPNIILIYTDDMDPYLFTDEALNLYGPNIKEHIKDKGTVFSNFISTIPLCGPVRASTLVGQYSHNSGILANENEISPSGNSVIGGFDEFRARNHDTDNIGVYMQKAGYKTAYVGKYHNNGFGEGLGEEKIIPGWDEQYLVGGAKYFEVSTIRNGVQGKSAAGVYRTDIEAIDAKDMITQSALDSEPLFMVVAPYAPHAPEKDSGGMVPDRYLSLFTEEIAPQNLYPNFNEESISDKPSELVQLPQLNASQVERINAFHRDRLRAMKAVDDLVEIIIDELEDTDQLDDTYIFFTSDNGYQNGEHRLTAKKAPYLATQRYPMFVAGPGVKQRTVDHLVANIDLYPTFLNLGRSLPRTDVDGRSLVTLLLHNNIPEKWWRESLLVENWTSKNTPQRVPVNTEYKEIITNQYMYTSWYNGDKEYYDIQADPYQLENIYDSLTEEEKIELDLELTTLASCSDSAAHSCRPKILITSPEQSVPYTVGTVLPIRWSTQRFNEERIRISLIKNHVNIDNLTINDYNDGIYDWEIPGDVEPGDFYRIRIIAQRDSTIYANSPIFSISSSTEEIEQPEPSPTSSQQQANVIGSSWVDSVLQFFSKFLGL